MSKAAFSLYTALLLEIAAGFTTNPVALSCEGLVSPPPPLRGGDRRQRRVLGTYGAALWSCPLSSQVALFMFSVCLALPPNCQQL